MGEFRPAPINVFFFSFFFVGSFQEFDIASLLFEGGVSTLYKYIAESIDVPELPLLW